MKTEFHALALFALAIVGATATICVAQDFRYSGPIQLASGEDYSVDYTTTNGVAFASDIGKDPSWITNAPGLMPQYNMHAGKVPAELVAQQNSQDNAPPLPPGMRAPGASSATDQGNSEQGGNGGASSNSNNSNGSGTSLGGCATCKNGTCGCNSCGSSGCTTGTCGCTSTGGCGDCCDSCDSCDSCPRHHCHGLIQIPDDCPLECCDEEPCRAFGDCCWLKDNNTSVFGWIDGGIMGNAQSPFSHFNGPVTFPDRDDGQLNQFYGAIERTAECDNCGWFIGGRADMYWGSDFIYTTAAGLDGRPVGNVPRWNSTNSFLYGWSMPQLYAEIDYDDVKVKAGHFYSPIGYEVAPAVGNFFYTHSYARQYGEPFTHTGVLASQPLNENWTWYAGIDNGWNAFDCNSRANFLGGVSFHDDCWGSLAFMIQTGDDSTFDTTTAGLGPFANRTVYSLVWQRDFTSRLTYVLEHNLGVQQNADTVQGIDTAEWYGITNYLFYKINNCWQVGARFEWFRDDDGFAVTGLRPGNPLVGNFFAGNFYETSLGLNWKPNANFTLRPEIRWDWFNGLASGGQPFNNNTANHQFLFGLDAIFQF